MSRRSRAERNSRAAMFEDRCVERRTSLAAPGRERESIAQLAAQLIAEHGIGDWSLAKRKAARQLGIALVEGIEAQTPQVFSILRTVAAAAGGSLDDIVKLTLMLADLRDFVRVNEIMPSYFKAPYPARATYQVAALPRGARVEVEGILVLSQTR
jgi:reactive intermediate/imine deaminase